MDKNDLVFNPHKHKFSDAVASESKKWDDLLGEGENEAITLDERFGKGWHKRVRFSNSTPEEPATNPSSPDHAAPLATSAIHTAITKHRD